MPYFYTFIEENIPFINFLTILQLLGETNQKTLRSDIHSTNIQKQQNMKNSQKKFNIILVFIFIIAFSVASIAQEQRSDNNDHRGGNGLALISSDRVGNGIC